MGEIYALPIIIDMMWCGTHLTASILFKDFSENIYYILNNSHVISLQEKIDPENYLPEKVNVIDLSLKTQFQTKDCQIISISTMAIAAEKVDQALLNQNTEDTLKLDIEELKNILVKTFKERSNEELESNGNRNTLVRLLELDDSVLDTKLKAILYRDSSAFRKAVERQKAEEESRVLSSDTAEEQKIDGAFNRLIINVESQSTSSTNIVDQEYCTIGNSATYGLQERESF